MAISTPHIVDMMRFVTGEEITEICGAIAETFIKERPLMAGSAAGGIAAGLKKIQKKPAKSLSMMQCCSWPGSQAERWPNFEAARQATGNFQQ